MRNSVSSVKAAIFLGESAGSNEVDEKKTYINELNVELEAKIFSYLKPSDLGNICAIDKRRNKVVCTSGEKTPSLKDRAIYRDFAFNSKDWKTYFQKDVDTEGEIAFFPKNIWKELNKPSQVFPRARIGQVYMLTWMPKTMNRGKEPLTINSMERILKKRFLNNISNLVTLEHGERGVPKSYWVFMTMNVIPESRGKSYATQRELVANLDRRNPYEVPKILEAIVCVSTKYFKTGERLFSDNPWTYTQCQEQVQDYQIVVGGFAPKGFLVSNYDVCPFVGAAALRKLCDTQA